MKCKPKTVRFLQTEVDHEWMGPPVKDVYSVEVTVENREDNGDEGGQKAGGR